MTQNNNREELKRLRKGEKGIEKKNHNFNVINTLRKKKKSVRPKKNKKLTINNQVLHIHTLCPAHAFCWPL